MGRSRGAPYRNNNPSTNLRNKSPPMKKSKRKETTLENLNINFGPPATPNEKKTSNESTERFIFLEKAFDKAFQLEDAMPSPGDTQLHITMRNSRFSIIKELNISTNPLRVSTDAP